METALPSLVELLEKIFARLTRVENRIESNGNQERATEVDKNTKTYEDEVLEVNATQSSIPGRKRKIQDQRGNPTKKPDTEDKMTEDAAKHLIGKSRGELLAELLKEEKERKLAQRKPNYLTAEEQEIGRRDLGELDRFWKESAGYHIRDSDTENIGTLTSDEVALPRHYIREIIGARRTENYIRRMKARGKEVIRCENCNKAYEKNRAHQCISTNWKTSTFKKGMPAEKRIIISQTGSGAVQIGHRTILDQQKMDKAFRMMEEMKRAEEGKRAFAPFPEQDMVVELEDDDIAGQLEGESNDQVVAANHIYIQEDQNLSTQRNFRYGEFVSPLQ
jgi:hypothetical protein